MSELKEQNHPEIIRSNMASTILSMMTLGVRDLVHFDYLDSPAPESIMRALELLHYLSALDDESNLTPLGSLMSKFPLEPQVCRTFAAE